jgi:hypothetical protein
MKETISRPTIHTQNSLSTMMHDDDDHGHHGGGIAVTNERTSFLS